MVGQTFLSATGGHPCPPEPGRTVHISRNVAKSTPREAVMKRRPAPTIPARPPEIDTSMMLTPLTPAQEKLRARVIRLINTRMKSGEPYDSTWGTIWLYVSPILIALLFYKVVLTELAGWSRLSLENRFWLIWF